LIPIFTSRGRAPITHCIRIVSSADAIRAHIVLARQYKEAHTENAGEDFVDDLLATGLHRNVDEIA
jgi:hypothetical protein